jgi:hypothetical protein
MWVKGSPMQFIIDSGSQKNLISVKVVKRLKFANKHTHNHTPSVAPPRDKIFTSANSVAFLIDIKPFADEVLCDVSL